MRGDGWLESVLIGVWWVGGGGYCRRLGMPVASGWDASGIPMHTYDCI